ncbi:LysR family transcriptional regulator [Novosphingobium sp. SG720]|uniref:LysR family transcriptional regulator n=1 Tax=Novosphingobium sp. SG720 TaxID=2586998 RepID=UPI001444A8A2|nr:LysR family transcriptional regulator [Novosphingobium sp. SG720]NKJ44816.1 DNA-binding transcriptional LysR family regulator [Novosphingobium sp. SG720]
MVYPDGGEFMRFDKLDLNLLVAFDVLIEECSVSAAARRLNMSQSATSGALARLREFFQDSLLVQVGRVMVPTEVGLELAGRVREVLTLIRATITTPIAFDPSTIKRNFRIAVSDYVYDVALAEAIKEIQNIAPDLTFDLCTPNQYNSDRFQRGEIDIFITIEEHTHVDHPGRPLFQDQLKVIAWDQEPAENGELTFDEFLRRPHVDVTFGQGRAPSFSERFISEAQLALKTELRVESFNAVAMSVIGTRRMALLNGLHAKRFSRLLPLLVYPLPMSAPPIREVIQWHSMRRGDTGLQWLKEQIFARSQAIVQRED